MRSVTILLAVMLVLAALPAQAADGKGERPQMMARLVGALLERAGVTLSGDENELKPTVVDGTGNTVLNIGELVINVNVGDVSLEKEFEGAGPSGEDAGRLVDLLMQRLDERDKLRDQQRREPRGVAMIPPPYSNKIFGNTGPTNIQSNSGWDQQYRQESRAAQQQAQEHEGEASEQPATFGDRTRGPGADKRLHFDLLTDEGRRGFDELMNEMRSHEGKHSDMPGGVWGPQAAETVEGRGRRGPQAWGMPGRMRPDVDPEFMGLMMRIGKLARMHPRFREALERMVQKAETRAAAGVGAGQPGHGKHKMKRKAGERKQHAKRGKHAKQGKRNNRQKTGDRGKHREKSH